ncbi:phosphate-starvation-inducible PsiE family protein [Nitrospira sp. Kam-Ns4a]
MFEPTDERMRRWVAWMRWLDRWGYVTAGFSFLFLGMLVFAYSWGTFAMAARAAFLPAALTLVNDLLLVIILLELFRTIVRFLQTDIITLEPFLNIGIIASIRRILTAGAELAHLTGVSEELFQRYLLDIGLNVAVVMVLMLAVLVVRKSPADPSAPVPSAKS